MAPASAPASAAPRAAVHYRVEALDAHAHLFGVTLRIARPAAAQQVMLPVWIPGSYLVREFARHVQGLQARQGQRVCAVRALDKQRWQIDCAAGRPLTLTYRVYAHDPSVRAAFLDASRGFFNGTSLLLRVPEQDALAHQLRLVRSRWMRGWKVATGLRPQAVDADGFGDYRADGYDELVDHPFELGIFWSGDFSAGGVPHRFVVAGASAAFDGQRLLADAQKICETALRFWHPRGKPPFAGYTFMLNAVDDGYGGLEHRNSTALLCKRADLPRLGLVQQAEGYTALLGLISHEYFHAWNVKRLRPAEFARYDYSRENHTELLWLFEGFTSYYDDLLLRRAGRIDDAGYLKLLGKTINQVWQTPGRRLQSVAQASFDAWTKYYRPDENTPNASVSYYSKGALVALCLDLTLRREGASSLDELMRGLWKLALERERAGGAATITEADVADLLARLGGRSFAAELQAWVHGTDDLPLAERLGHFGVRMLEEPAPLAQRLGLRVSDGDGIHVKTVLGGGAAQAAGFSAGDEWLGIEADGAGWRLRRLDDLALYLPHAGGSPGQVTALVARDQRLLRLPLQLPAHASVWRLALHDAAALRPWLSAAAP